MKHPESVGPVPVVRTIDGYWCHPALNLFYADREYVQPAEYNNWLTKYGLEDNLTYLEDEGDTAAGGDEDRSVVLIHWRPPVPEGGGWFIGAIYDDENYGATCIWLRRREVPCDAS